jgi:hypothetical protein
LSANHQQFRLTERSWKEGIIIIFCTFISSGSGLDGTQNTAPAQSLYPLSAAAPFLQAQRGSSAAFN